MEGCLGRIEVEKIPEELGGGWRAYVIGMEEVLQADGESPEEATKNLEELMEEMIKEGP